MVSRRQWIAAGAAVLVILALVLFYPTDRRKVKRLFGHLASWVAKDGDEGALAAVQTAQHAKDFFADPCEWKTEEQDLTGSLPTKDIAQMMFAFRSHFSQISLKFYDLTIDFPEDGAADATATARLAASSKEGQELNETREIRCQLRKVDGDWLVTQVTVVQVLKK